MKVFQFQKERSADNIIEASFMLLRKHFKPMFSILWKYNAVLIMGYIFSYFMFYLFFTRGIQNFSRNIFRGQREINNLFGDPKFILTFLVMLIFSIILYPRFYATILGYIRVYKENNGVVTPEKVNVYIKEKFWGLIGMTLLLVLVAVIYGFIFGLFSEFVGFISILLLVGIVYLSIIVTIMYPTYMFEDISVTEAITKGFSYVKTKWWFVFGTMFLMGIILWFLGLVADTPIYIYSYIKDIGAAKGAEVIEQNLDVILAVISVISLIIGYILRTASLITTALTYFSLREYHTQEGILDRIDSIGKED